jgi:hypothetical protein
MSNVSSGILNNIEQDPFGSYARKRDDLRRELLEMEESIVMKLDGLTSSGGVGTPNRLRSGTSISDALITTNTGSSPMSGSPARLSADDSSTGGGSPWLSTASRSSGAASLWGAGLSTGSDSAVTLAGRDPADEGLASGGLEEQLRSLDEKMRKVHERVRRKASSMSGHRKSLGGGESGADESMETVQSTETVREAFPFSWNRRD